MTNKKLKRLLGGLLTVTMLMNPLGGLENVLAAEVGTMLQKKGAEVNQVETTTAGVIDVVPNLLLKLLDSSDEDSAFTNFIKLFESQSYWELAQQEPVKWQGYLDSLEKSVMNKWMKKAIEDQQFGLKLIKQLLIVLETESEFIALTSSADKTMETLLREQLTSLYEEYKKTVSFSGQEYVDVNIDFIYQLDLMKKTLDPSEYNFMTDIYLSKLWFDVGAVLNEDFQSSTDMLFYQKVIYAINYVYQKGIQPVGDVIITGMSAQVVAPRVTTSSLSTEGEVATMSLANNENTEVVAPTSTEEAIKLVANKMRGLKVSVDSQYDFYSGLDRSQLTSNILSSYQGMVDSRRGIVGSYYTGIYSPDYDASVDQADRTDTGVRLGTSFELVALKLEEKGGEFDIRRSLYGLYKEEINNSNLHKGLKKVVYKAYIRTPELGTVTIGQETANFTFGSAVNNIVGGQAQDASEGIRVSISITEDGVEQLTKDGKIYAGTLKENTLYEFEATVRVLDYVNDLPDQVQLKWSYQDVSTQVIPNRYFFVDSQDSQNLTSKKNLKLVNLDPAGDADNDGLPNAWEIEGFVFDRTQNHLVKYDPKVHAGLQVYYTSPVDSSSDGDPYSDLEEVLSTNIDVLSDAGKHPMVAAYPEYVVELEGLTLNARLQSKYSTSQTDKTVNLNSSNNTVVNKYTRKTSLDKGFTAGGSISQSVGYVQGPVNIPGVPVPGVAAGVKVEGSSSVFVSGKYGKLEDNEYITTTVSSTTYSTTEDATTAEQLATTANTFKSADLSFNIKVKNIGSATGYDIRPNLSFYIGNEVSRTNPAITTVDVPVAVDSLAPGSSSQTFQVSNTQTTESGRKIDLTINQETYQKILKGYPITMQMNSADSQVIAKNQARGPWDDYVNKINGISATINHQDAVNGLRTYKVFATKSEDTVRPNFTIGMSLQNIYKSAFTVEKSVKNGEQTFIYKINGKNITAINVYADDISQFAEAFSNGATVVNFFNVVVRPGMVIQVETSNTTETKPFILNATYKKGVISAYVLGNCSEVKTVKARVQYDGVQQDLELTQSQDNALLYTYEFDNIVNINIESNNLIFATDVNGNSNEAKLYIADAYYIKEEQSRIAYGTTYKELSEDRRITTKQDALDLVATYPAESYVFYRSRGDKGNYQKASAVYTRAQVEAFTDLGYALNWGPYPVEIYCQGYFVSGDEGSRFRLLAKQEYPLYLKDGQRERAFSINTGAENPTAYIIMIGSTDRANNESGTNFELNGRYYQGPVWNAEILTNYMMIIDADDLEPETISGKITVPNGSGAKKYNLQVVGYFTKEAGYRYKTLSSAIELPTLASNATETMENAIEDPRIVEKPKAYLLKVSGANTSSNHIRTYLDINGIKVSNSRTTERTGSFSIYVVVPNDPNGNKISVDVVNPVSDPTANYDFKITGYFY